MRCRLGWMIALAGTLLAGGCADDPSKGYTFQSLHQQDVDSVAVEMFSRGRQVYRRGLEMRLTEAVVKQIQLGTPYRVLPKSQADTLLTGELTQVSQRILNYNPYTGHPRELELVIRLSFRWVDLRSGKTRKAVGNLPVTGSYIVDPVVDEDFFQGSADVIDEAARRVVEHMERDW